MASALALLNFDLIHSGDYYVIAKAKSHSETAPKKHN